MKQLPALLLIEDDRHDHYLFETQLKRTGQFASTEVVHAESLAAATEILSTSKFDIIIADLNLPDGRHLEVIETLMAVATDSAIIACTGNNDPEFAERFLAAGAQNYLVKGEFDVVLLERTIRYALQRRQANLETKSLVKALKRKRRALRRKNRELQSLVTMANDFVDNVSHEFRTPLTVILDHAHILNDELVGPVNDKQHCMIEKIIDRSDDLNNMVNDMLDSSRLSAGIIGFQRERSRIADVIERAASALELKAALRSVDLQFDVPDSLSDAFCDPEKLGRVVTNLATNAIKFCGEPGEVIVSVRERTELRELAISVTDNGDGMSDEEVAVIYERFKQLDNAETCKAKGFGLGLNIVRELVSLNLGELEIQTSPGHGTTFTVTVPIYDCSEVLQRYSKRLAAEHIPSVELYRATTTCRAGEEQLPQIRAFWKYIQKKHDLVFEIQPGDWIVATPRAGKREKPFVERVQSNRLKLNKSRPIDPLAEIAVTSLAEFKPNHVDSNVLLSLRPADPPEQHQPHRPQPSSPRSPRILEAV